VGPDQHIAISHFRNQIEFTMTNFSHWKQRAVSFKKKLTGKTKSSRWNRLGKREKAETIDTSAELPLLKTVTRKTKKASWEGSDETKDMSDFAAASALIAATFSEDTKSTSSGGLYHATNPQEERVEFANFHTRGIFMPGDVNQKATNDVKKKNIHTNDFEVQKTTLPSYSISGSMLCSNIEQGKIQENSTSAARNMPSRQKQTGLPPNAVMASTLFRTMNLDQTTERTKKNPGEKAPLRNLYSSASTESNDDEAPYVTINRSNSSDGAQSSVSALTMYSTSQNDPLVRASNSLLDILRSNRFENFDEETASALYEA
jgi:hypothetical protein